MNKCLKKLKKTVSTSRNKIWSPSNGNNGFKENMNKRISFSFPIENLLPLAVIVDSFKICFNKVEKRLPVERIFEKLEQNGFL